MSGPSDKAVELAQKDFEHKWHKWNYLFHDSDQRPGIVSHALHQAHSPALGLDRSVCLRDVVEKLRCDQAGMQPLTIAARHAAAEHIEREFGGGS